MVKDRFHDVVRTALEKEGWKITAAVDRYQLRLLTYDVQQEVITRWL
jgi:hypothetical protein